MILMQALVLQLTTVAGLVPKKTFGLLVIRPEVRKEL